MDLLDPEVGQELNLLLQRIPKWSGWLASLVLDQSGSHKGPDDNSKSISNETDLKLLLSLRNLADEIITTGKTARAENYASSRYAPITFLTKDPDSLKETKAFQNPGQFPNKFFSTKSEETLFLELNERFVLEGAEALLYEGGPSLLPELISQIGKLNLVVTIANLEDPASVSPLAYLMRLGLGQTEQELQDDFCIGPNRVTRWLISR